MDDRPMAHARDSVVRGTVHEGISVFRGIPYATAERFRAPVPAAPWSGELEASAFGPVAPQVPGAQFQRPDLTQDEHCLSLNVWTPGADDQRRPVMVWIHGGAFRTGSSASPLYEGTTLARRGDVVVVSINYRLGALGFLSHPALSIDGEPLGNWGLLDCVEALRWVQDNAAAFGGDPANVTVFGESAGAAAVSLLCVMPDARGLFHKAIVQSGAPLASDVATASTLAEQLADAVTGGDVAALRTAPVADVLAGQIQVEAGVERAFIPVVEGTTIPLPRPLASLAAGSASGVPTIIGTNVDEWKLWAAADPRSRDLDEPGLQRRLARRFPNAAVDELVQAVRDARVARGEAVAPNDVYYAIESERTFRVHSIRMAEAQAAHAPTYMYLFEWGSPAMNGWLGACHGLEIAFVFGNQGKGELAAFTGAGPDADALAERMMDAWLAFVHTGDPSTSGAAWPTYDTGTRPTMVFGRDARVEAAPREAERAVITQALLG